MTDTVVFWDLDGTLLTTARAGVFALEDAAEAVAGARVDLTSLATAGLTDAEVARAVLAAAGADPTRELVLRFLAAYERRLPDRLHCRRGKVMPGVRAILDDLVARPDVHTRLLTGNTRPGAFAKLRHYDLDRYFSEGGFTEDGAFDRATIARRAVAEAAASLGDRFDPERVFLVGDTPFDISAGSVIGAKAIAVAHTHPLAELRAAGPWRAIARLPEPAGFERLLGLNAR